MSKAHDQFCKERSQAVANYEKDERFSDLSQEWVECSMRRRYVYNFDWLGRPIIQYPQDIVAVQELVWEVKPDLIIETGIAHGGSLILSASMLAMLDYCEAVEQSVSLNPKKSARKVVGIDIDIREHNREAILSHPLSHMIHMVEGSSISSDVIEQVSGLAEGHNRVMVFLDSNHTHDHVLAELEAYAELTSVGSYCVVFDTFVEKMPRDLFPDRPWDVGNNPMTAVEDYLESTEKFVVDSSMENKLQITVAPKGFLQRVS